jgi:hypothetical protein
MTRPISTRAHGMIDYAYAATLIALPFALGWRGRAARLSIGSGLATLGLSLLTRYEFGVMPVLPMKAHLAADAAESSMLMSAPRILQGSNTTAGRMLAALGALGGLVGSMTQTQPPRQIAHR